MLARWNIIPFFLLTLSLLACGPQGGTEATDGTEGDNMEAAAPAAATFPMTKNGLTLYPLEGSPAFPNASLSLESMDVTPEGKGTFSFAVEGYELGAQTASTPPNGLANSGGGQHIHFIVDNGPYAAYYEPGFEHEVGAGEHVFLAFLSRSYHESVKNGQAFAVFQTAGGSADLDAPHMFFSRPKGTYTGADTEKLLLDFFLINADLSPDGYKVRATINGTDFLLDQWQPYVIEGLEMGEVAVKLEFLDADGSLVESPFNPVERTVVLAPAAAE